MTPTRGASSSHVRPERILLIAPRFHSNQADFVRKLREEGHDLLFLATDSTKSEDHSQVTPHILKPTWLGTRLNHWRNPANEPVARAANAVPSFREVWSELSAFEPEAAVVKAFLAPYLVPILAWLVVHRTPIVIFAQGAKFRSSQSLVRRLGLSLLLDVLGLKWFTVVERRVDQPSLIDSHPRMAFIPFFRFVPTDVSKRTYGRPPRLLAVGKYNRRKNFAALITALGMVHPGPGVRLTIVGECSRPEHREVLAELHELIERLQLQDCVELLQNLEYAEVQSLYEAHDVFVMPSYGEPASVSQIEAMSYGLAVICSADNGTAHYVQDGVNGFIVDRTAESIAVALERYLNESGLAEQHGRASTSRLQGEFSVEAAYQHIVSLIRDNPR